jgi:small subunit ribosomal protein S9
MTETTQTYATGRRKRAVARVWLKAGTGNIEVNKVPCDTYFERETSRMILRQSLELAEVIDKFDVRATVCGGGKSAQAEAIRHGISRALSSDNPDHRRVLKRAGFITRDAREKERKKPGQPGARKRFQFSKR